MVADVQQWLDNRAINYGWILIAGEESRTAKRFDTRENEIEEFRPVLEVNYSRTETALTFPARGLIPTWMAKATWSSKRRPASFSTISATAPTEPSFG